MRASLSPNTAINLEIQIPMLAKFVETKELMRMKITLLFALCQWFAIAIPRRLLTPRILD